MNDTIPFLIIVGLVVLAGLGLHRLWRMFKDR
jgi:FtsZ-interacting cell division protein ZipA